MDRGLLELEYGRPEVDESSLKRLLRRLATSIVPVELAEGCDVVTTGTEPLLGLKRLPWLDTTPRVLGETTPGVEERPLKRLPRRLPIDTVELSGGGAVVVTTEMLPPLRLDESCPEAEVRLAKRPLRRLPTSTGVVELSEASGVVAVIGRFPLPVLDDRLPIGIAWVLELN